MIDDGEIDDECFDSVAARAIGEWPARLDVSILSRSGVSELYSVVGLSDIDEALFDLHKDTAAALLMSEMHMCLRIMLHAAAQYLTVLYPKDVRISELRELFVSRMRYYEPSSESSPRGLDWKPINSEMVRSALSKKAVESDSA